MCKRSTGLNFTHSASNQALCSGVPVISDRQLSESERVAVQRALIVGKGSRWQSYGRICESVMVALQEIEVGVGAL